MHNHIPSNTEYYNTIGYNRDTFYREKKSCVSNTVCDDCIAKINSNCIIYNGSSFIIPPIQKGQNLNDVLKTIINNLGDKNVQSNWTMNDPSDPSFIQNKPDLSIYYLASNPAGYIDSSYVTWDNVSNKPVFSQVAFTGNYNDLINIPPPQPTPNLQSVTDEGNTTTNVLVIKGVDNVGGHGEGLYLGNYPGVGSQILAGDPMVGYYGYLNFLTSGTSQLVTENSLSIDSVNGFVSVNGDGISIQAQTIAGVYAGTSAQISGDTVNILANSSAIGSLFLNGNAPIRIEPSAFMGVSPADADIIAADRYFTLLNLATGGRGIVRVGGYVGGMVASQRRGGISGANTVSQISLDTLSATEPNIILQTDVVANTTAISRRTTNNSGTPSLHFRDNSGVITNTLFADGRMSGSDAINNNEFVTLQQIPTSNNIYNSNGILTGNRSVSGGGNNLAFTGMADFRVLGQSFSTFILNDNQFHLTDGTSGTLSGQGGNTTLSTPGDLTLWSASSDSPGKAILFRVGASNIPLQITDLSDGIAATFTGRVQGIDAVNLNEYVTLQQVIGSGTVTSVGLSLPSIFNVTNSPVTTSGTLTGTLATQITNTVFAAPNGSTGIPTFRTLVANDIPTLTASKISDFTSTARGLFSVGTGLSYNSGTGQFVNTSPDQVVTLTQGSNVTITGTYPNFTISSSSPGTGTVTSVGLTSSDITVGGTSPITTSGTFTLTLPNINANVGTFNNVTVNAKGQVTAASNVTYATATNAMTFTNKTGNISQWTNDVGYITSFTEVDPIANAKTVTINVGTGLSRTVGSASQTVGANPSFTLVNTAPDQTVVLNNGTGISVTGTYPNFTITNTSPNTNQNLDQVLGIGNTSLLSATVSELSADAGSGLGRDRVRITGSTTGQGFIRNEVDSGGGFSVAGTLSILSNQINIGDGSSNIIISNGDITVPTKVYTSDIRISGGTPGVGKVWTGTDSSGNGQWENPVSGSSIITTFTTDESNATGGSDIYNTNIPSSYLNVNGNVVRATYGGEYTGSETRLVAIKYNGNIVHTFSVPNANAPTGDWRVDVSIIRISNTTIRYTSKIAISNNLNVNDNQSTLTGEVTGLNLSSSGLDLSLFGGIVTSTAGTCIGRFGFIEKV